MHPNELVLHKICSVSLGFLVLHITGLIPCAQHLDIVDSVGGQSALTNPSGGGEELTLNAGETGQT